MVPSSRTCPPLFFEGGKVWSLMNRNKIFCGSYWTPIDLKKSKNKMFHVGNFTPNFHGGLNPGPPAPLASVLPLRHKVKELPGPKIWKVIDLSISLVFRQIEQILFQCSAALLDRWPLIFLAWTTLWARSAVARSPRRVQEVPGSNPGRETEKLD